MMSDQNEARTALLRYAIAGNRAALEKLIADFGELVPERHREWVCNRVAGVLRPDISLEHVENLVVFNAEEAEVRELWARIQTAEELKLIEDNLRGMLNACSPPECHRDLLQEAWAIALPIYDPDKGSLLKLLRTIIWKAAPRFRNPREVQVDDASDEVADQSPLSEHHPPEAFEAFLHAVCEQQPHKAVVFILRRLMERQNADIHPGMTSIPLGRLVEKVETMYRQRVDNAAVRRSFKVLQNGVGGTDHSLSYYFTRDPHFHLSEWTREVFNAAMNDLARQQVRFLSLIFSLHSLEPFKILSYAYLMLLRWPNADLWARSDSTLFCISDDFPSYYPSLTAQHVSECMLPTVERLRRPILKPIGHSTLASHAGVDRDLALSRWRAEAQLMIRKRAGEDGLIAIAYINGAADAIRRRRRRREIQ